MLWLAVAFPDLGLAVHTRALPPGAAPRPLALVHEGRVLAGNAEAAAAGVQRGQRTANAVALCPPLRFLEHLPGQEARLLRQLAESCIAITPTVVLAPPHTLLLEIGGCLQLFRGQPALLKQLRRCLRPFGVATVLAQAPTPKAARALVACDQAAASLQVLATPGTADPAPAARTPSQSLRDYLPLLRAVPVTALPWEEALQQKLRALHLHTVGELLALPRAALSKRLGVAATRYLAQLEGVLPDPQTSIVVAEDFEATLFFLDGISHVEGLRFPMKRLLDDFCRFLRQRQLSCARFAWRFAHQDKSRQSLVIASARGEPQAARFMQLSELKLEHFRISAPVEGVTLVATEFQPQTDTRLALLPDPGQEDDKALALLDRLRARLGGDACQLVATQDTHRPEAAQQLGTEPTGGLLVDGYPARFPRPSAAAGALTQRPRADSSHTRAAADAAHNIPPGQHAAQQDGMPADPANASLATENAALRPFWLWPEPKALRLIDGRLWWQGVLTLLSRPERIALPWWEDSDTRDYYLARHENGVHYWIYFSHQRQAWFCQGVFG